MKKKVAGKIAIPVAFELFIGKRITKKAVTIDAKALSTFWKADIGSPQASYSKGIPRLDNLESQ